jgi:hypothetical protein
LRGVTGRGWGSSLISGLIKDSTLIGAALLAFYRLWEMGIGLIAFKLVERPV